MDQPPCVKSATPANESKEEHVESDEHSKESNSEADKIPQEQVAAANKNKDKSIEATVDLDSIPVSDLIKLKFSKNFEGHGIFPGYIEVSIW